MPNFLHPKKQIKPFSDLSTPKKYLKDDFVENLFRGYHNEEIENKKSKGRIFVFFLNLIHRLWSITFLLPIVLVLQIIVTASVVFAITYSNSLMTAETLSLQLMSQANDNIYNQLNELMQTPYNVLNVLTVETSNHHIFITNHSSSGNFSFETYRQSELYAVSLSKIFPSSTLVYWSNDFGDFIGFENDNGNYNIYRKWSYGNLVEINSNTSFEEFCTLSGGNQNLTITQSDSEGNIISGGSSLIICGWDARIRLWYQAALETPGIVRISSPYIFGDGNIGFTFSKSVNSKVDNSSLGVIASDFKLSGLNTFLEQVEVGKTGRAFIMTKDGKFFASNNPNSLTMFGNAVDYFIDIANVLDVPDPLVHESGKQILERYGSFYNIFSGSNNYKGATIYWDTNINGDSSYIFISNFNYGENADWLIVVILPKNDFLSNIYTANIISISMTCLFVVFAIIIAFIVTCIIIYPLFRLGKRMKKVSNMQLDAKKPLIPSLYEVHQIQNSFSNMVKALRFFKKFIPSSIIQRVMVEDEKSVTQIKEIENMSLIFIDIVNFTSFSEILKPNDLLSLMSTALDLMTRIILQNQGVIDSYIGDAIFALFGVDGVNDDSHHAVHAAIAALECHKKIKELEEVWKEYGVDPLKIRIGINSGPCLVGCFGSREKMTFSCLGDVVNLASRLESLCNGYGVGSLISSDTYKEIKHEIVCRALDIVVVKGRTGHTVIYTLEALRSEATPDQISAEKISREMLKYMKAGDGEETRRYIDSILEMNTYKNDHAMKLLKSRTYLETFGIAKYSSKSGESQDGKSETSSIITKESSEI